MTARPQDVALLPLPELPVPHGGMTGDYWTDDQIEEYAADYARANVTAALASAQAREDELRAEVERLRASARSAGEAMGVEAEARADAEWKVVQLAEEVLKSRERAERLAEALREARASAAAARTGYSGQHASGTFRRMVQKIDAALSTNAATQTGE